MVAKGASVFVIFIFVSKCLALDERENNSIGRGLDPKSMLSSIASSFMSRGYIPTASGGSQIVSLNLTNLLVLILLKALIFAAGSLGAGTWKGGFGRSNDGEEKFLTDDEILMFLSFLTGAPGNNGCLQKISCEDPHQAKKYVTAGDMLIKASKMLSFEPDETYNYVLHEVDEAANVGLRGENCSRYMCQETQKNK